MGQRVICCRRAIGYNHAVSADERRSGSSDRHIQDMTTGSIPRHLIAFALPMLAGSLLQTTYIVVNAFWVGRYLKESALAAVTVSTPILILMIAVAGGLTLATNILIAQDIGAHTLERVQKVVQTSIVLVAAISLLLLVGGLLSAPYLLRHLLLVPPDIYPQACGFLHIALWTVPCTFAIFLFSAMLRGIGDSKTPVYFQAISVVLNVILDPLFMLGKLGFPRLGIDGAAWATLFAQTTAAIALLYYITHHCRVIRPDLWHPQIDRHVMLVLLMIGLPAMLQQSVVSISLLGITRYVSAFGTLADAAFGAALRIDNVAFLPAMTMGLAISTVAGQNIGAQYYGRAREVFWWGLLLSVSISLLISTVVISMPQVFLHFFIRNPIAVAEGIRYLHIVGITYVLYAVMFAANGVINGAGQTLATTIISVISLWGIRLPLAALLPHITHNQTGIWYAMLISVAVGMIMSLLYYASGRWQCRVENGQSAVNSDE